MTVRRYEIVVLRRESQTLTLEALASCTGLHPALLERFVDFGLIDPIEGEGRSLLFDPATIPRLRMIKRLRESLGINLAGIAVIQDLVDKLCALQRENEAFRRRL